MPLPSFAPPAPNDVVGTVSELRSPLELFATSQPGRERSPEIVHFATVGVSGVGGARDACDAMSLLCFFTPGQVTGRVGVSQDRFGVSTGTTFVISCFLSVSFPYNLVDVNAADRRSSRACR